MKPTAISSYFDILGKARKVYGKQLEPVCRKWELTRSELDVMLFLYSYPEHNRAADIVSGRGMAKSHVSISVASLAERGLLQRQLSTDDRRTALLFLTEQGRVIAGEAQIAQNRFFETIYAGIPREELAVLRKVTRKITDNVEKLEKKEGKTDQKA